MTVSRRTMIDTLAGAAIGPHALSLTPDFDYAAARQEFAKLTDEELNARYGALQAFDRNADGTDDEVIVFTDEQHFQIG